MNCYQISRRQLVERCPFPLTIVPDCKTLDAVAARKVVDLIRQRNEAGEDTALILPVGPLQYGPFAALCNSEQVSLERLTLFMMDEYLQPDGTPIPTSHPLSFRRFMMETFVSHLDGKLGFSPERLVFPLPPNFSAVTKRILDRGGVDLCFAGVGISGHLAFNDPPEPSEAAGPEQVRNSIARMVHINRESCTQMALGGTFGDWSIIPRFAGTLGMKEILASKSICLLGMRGWHAGTVRRALFGPVSPSHPASYLQEHTKVDVIMTEQAARPATVNVTLETGEEREPA